MRISKQFIPTSFKGVNGVLVSSDPLIKPVQIFSNGEVILSCWKMPLIERIRSFISGKVFVCCLGRTQPPMWLSSHAFEYKNIKRGNG